VNLVADAFADGAGAKRFDLDDWFHDVGTHFGALQRGHRPGMRPPKWMLAPGPLRDAFVDEFSFRARVEEAAVRGLAQVVAAAPSLEAMDFYSSQLIDEARHAYVFRQQLVEIGHDAERIEAVVAELSRHHVETILEPLQAFAEPYARARDFAAGAIMVAVIAEGALAPAAELSARKWRVLNPSAAEVAAGANRDEVRHLAVGTRLIGQYVREHEAERSRLMELIHAGMQQWAKLPIVDMLVRREQLFQQGIEQLRRELEGVELIPERPLIETTVEERLTIQVEWSGAMRTKQLKLMGLG
jgi:hypothetical protein